MDRIYQLNRANGHIDYDQLVVHTLPPGHQQGSVAASSGLRICQSARVWRLSDAHARTRNERPEQSPDAIMGAVPMGSTTAVDLCGKAAGRGRVLRISVLPETPAFALTNLVNRQAARRKPRRDHRPCRDHDRWHHLPEVGPAMGLFDPINDRIERYPLSRQRQHHSAG